MLDAVHDGILVLDRDRRAIRCNRRSLAMFGLTGHHHAGVARKEAMRVGQRRVALLSKPLTSGELRQGSATCSGAAAARISRAAP
jgi:PAS domain-containing protein